MCIKAIQAAEYDGKLYRSELEAAKVALQDVGAAIVKFGANNAGAKIEEHATQLLYLLGVITEARPPALFQEAGTGLDATTLSREEDVCNGCDDPHCGCNDASYSGGSIHSRDRLEV
jgi:hypothetical protein